MKAMAKPVTDGDPSRSAADYHLLHKYLRDRYADRLVLTFAQIEDLMGFPLPEVARTDPAWWDDLAPGAGRSPQADSWTRAGRVATANVPAEIVGFERGAPPGISK
jgi:hypothetical protein